MIKKPIKQMKNLTKSLLVASFICAFSSCASIVSKSNWPLTVNTNPNGVKVEVTDKRGATVYEGLSPTTIYLKSGSGFFSSQSYVLKLTMEGYETKSIAVKCNLNGWYFGNIVFGGLIGILIVDPATGAMYKLEREIVNETLEKKDGQIQASLEVKDIKDIPASMIQHLVKISQ